MTCWSRDARVETMRLILTEVLVPEDGQGIEFVEG